MTQHTGQPPHPFALRNVETNTSDGSNDGPDAQIYDLCGLDNYDEQHDYRVTRQLNQSPNDWRPRLLECRTLDLSCLEENGPHASQYRISAGRSKIILEHADATASVDDTDSQGWHIFSMPGLTEHIEGDVRRHLQDGLSIAFPAARKTSIGSNGIGNLLSCDLTSLDTMARQRYELLSDLAANERIIAMGTSLGTKVVNGLVNLNLDEGSPLDCVQVLYSPALVTPRRTAMDMAARFLPCLVRDVVRHAWTLPVKERVQALGKLTQYGARVAADGVTLGHEVYDLLHGTPYEQIERAVSAHRTLVVVGEYDAIGEIPMWCDLEEKYPDTLRVSVIPNRGHDLPIFADGPEIISREIRRSGILEA